ncbi:hypothetical protein [Streptomyces sp. NPDC058623]
MRGHLVYQPRSLSDIDYYVSDDGLDEQARSVLSEAVGQLILGETLS